MRVHPPYPANRVVLPATGYGTEICYLLQWLKRALISPDCGQYPFNFAAIRLFTSTFQIDSMNPPELNRLAQKVNLDSEAQHRLRIAFGLACIERVEHLLTDDEIIELFSIGKAFVANRVDHAALEKAAENATKAARSHPGAGGLDGAGNAAVSVSHGVAAALAGRALHAAEYAAYASVYSYAGYAVTNVDAYTGEHAWQVSKLEELAELDWT